MQKACSLQQLLNQFLLMHSHTHTHTHKGWPRGEEIELAGCNAASCVFNQSRLRIQGYCKSLWSESESQRLLGEAALITRYDYSWGNACVCVRVVVRFVWESWADWLQWECASTSEYESHFEKCWNGDECQKKLLAFAYTQITPTCLTFITINPPDFFRIWLFYILWYQNKTSLFCSLFPLSLFAAGSRLGFPPWMSLFFTVC